MFCVYCGKELREEDATSEHVIPRAVGGNLEPANPFLLYEVCKTCNKTAGKFIDGPFIRSWFLSNDRALHALRCADLSKDPILPLAFAGELRGLEWSGKVCDVWRGPARTLCYHFHDPYEETKYQPGIVGPPLHLPARLIDPGFVMIFVRATNPAWHRPILRATLEHFDDCPRYLGNMLYQGPEFEPIPTSLRSLEAQLKEFIAEPHNLHASIAADFEQRFIAKLALGCGALFLQAEFRNSVDAQRLRDFMWEVDPSKRATQGIQFLSALETQPDSIKKLMTWRAGHIIMFYPIPGSLLLICTFYGHGPMAIQLSFDASKWPEDIRRDGRLYFIAPGLRRYFGPSSLQDFLLARVDGSGSDPLSTFLQEADRPRPQPPFDLPNAFL